MFNDQGGGRMDITEDITQTLRAEDHGHPPLILEAYGFKPRNGAKARSLGFDKEISPTLSTDENFGVVVEYGRSLRCT